MMLVKNILLVLLSLSCFGMLSFGQTTQIYDTPGAGSFTVPCDVTMITIALYGGGGGGGGSNSSTIGGGGGGAGGYAEATFAVTPGQIIPFTIGAGGIGGGPAGNGGPGAQTNLNPFSGLRAFGGDGGFCENLGGIGGLGGTGSAWAINATGGTGQNGNDPQGGQGGGAGGPNGGAGGPGGGAGVTGGTGSNYGGGGGGGGKKNGGINPSGGAGADGAVVITYTTPYPLPNAGPNVSTCNVIDLQGNTPQAPWVGTWIVTSSTGPYTIANVNDPNTNISLTNPGSCVTLEWTFTQAGCLTLTDEVTICYPALCNDDPCGAISVPVNAGACSFTPYSNVNATASLGMVEPGCGDWSDNDAWYSVTVPASGVVTINATDAAGGLAMTMGMAFYSEGSGGCNDMIHEGCDYATSSADAAEMTYTGTPGSTLYIRMWDVNEGEADFQLCAFEPAVPMGNIAPGSTTVACGGGALSFYDPGGDGGNYEDNTTAYYTLCPDTPGQFVTVDFTTGPLTFNTEVGIDFITVLNGAADSSFMIGQYSGNEAAGPGIITSSAPDGCLTLIFSSDNAISFSGWSATVDCSTTPGLNDSICSGTDCPGECGTWICESGLYPTENIGNNYEDMTVAGGGCFDNVGEIASQWFYFTALTSGTVELSFAGPGGQDYNFAIYGSTTNGEPPCPSTTQQPPIICSQADVSNYSVNGLTGLSSTLGGGEMYEGEEGDGWVDPLNIIAGETYSMLVNIYQNGGPQPVIDMTIGGTGTLDCTPVFLPIELHSFSGINQGDRNLLNWVTSTEINNDYFTIERSINGYDWEVVNYVDGAGNSSNSLYYSLVDPTPFFPVTYYRLSQTDYDGTMRIHNTIAINSEKDMAGDFVTQLFPNPTSSHATFTYSGIDTESPLVVSLINQLGDVVAQERYTTLYNGMPMTIRTDQVAGGMYQVVFEQTTNRDVQRLTILK